MDDKVQQLEISMAELKTNIEYIRKSQDKNDIQHKEILDKIEENSLKMDGFIASSTDRFVDKKYHNETMCEIKNIVSTLDSKYAPKSAWTILIWLARIIGTAMLLGLLGLIYKLIILIG
jgi:hypothetical protein